MSFAKTIILPILKIGSFGFGGPIAIIALIEQEFVHIQKRMSSQRFKELYAIVKLFPGAVAFQLLLAIIKEVTGSKMKAILAGITFLAPSFFLVLGIAAFLTKDFQSPSFQNALTGVQTAALALMAHSVVRLSSTLKLTKLSVAGVITALMITYPFPKIEPVLIFAYGLIALKPRSTKNFIESPKEVASLFMLFWVCFRASFLVFGTGIAIVPLLENDFVAQNQWISRADFLTALSVGQVTPGPILITTTFLGYQLQGILGALSTTLGTFLPGVLLSLWVLPLITKWMKTNQRGERFGNAAFLAVIGGLIASVTRMSIQSLHTVSEAAIFTGVLLGTFRFKSIPWIAWILISGVIHRYI